MVARTLTFLHRRALRVLSPVAGALAAVLLLTGSAALASGTPGTSIGDAENLTATASGTLPSANADDFYVVYPQTAGATIDLKVTDTTPSSPPTGCHTVVAIVSDTNGSALASATLGSTQFETFSVNATGSDRYFVELDDDACNPGSGPTASYQVQLTSGGGGTVPSPAASSAEPATDIGSAGPPLQGDTSLTGSLADSSQYDFYVVDKAADTRQGTIRVEDTSVHSATCRTVVAILSDTDGDAVASATLGGNQAHTFAVTAGGRYFLQLTDDGCNPGAGGPATYRVEPEPATEFTNPPAPPKQAVAGGATRAAATPLSGGIDYTDTVAGAATQDWFASQTDQSQFILTVENTGHKSDVNGPCQTIVAVLDDAAGNAVASATLGRDQAHQFIVTGPGTFSLEITDDGCNPGTDDPPPFEIHIVDGRPPGSPPTTTTTTTTTTRTTSTTTTTGPSCQAPAAQRAPRATSSCPARPPVVLLTGLADSHPGTTPAGTCAKVGTLQPLCQALKQAGYPVYVVSSDADPKAGTVIVNSQGFGVNGQRLARYLATVVQRPALLVGHSMGGIFSRVAISRDHARALGLFTIASPFDGSFGADIAEGSAHLPCPDTSSACAALHAAGAFAEQHFGAAALYDLTSVARGIDNRTIAPTGVPTWTFAGTACDPVPGPPSYLFPNDGIVGAASAYGDRGQSRSGDPAVGARLSPGRPADPVRRRLWRRPRRAERPGSDRDGAQGRRVADGPAARRARPARHRLARHRRGRLARAHRGLPADGERPLRATRRTRDAGDGIEPGGPLAVRRALRRAPSHRAGRAGQSGLRLSRRQPALRASDAQLPPCGHPGGGRRHGPRRRPDRPRGQAVDDHRDRRPPPRSAGPRARPSPAAGRPAPPRAPRDRRLADPPAGGGRDADRHRGAPCLPGDPSDGELSPAARRRRPPRRRLPSARS